MAGIGAELMVALKMKDDSVKALQGARNNFRDLAKTVRATGAVLTAVGGAITAVAGLSIKNFGEMGDEVQKMALRTGFSTEALSEWRHAIQISGADIKAFETGIKRMATFIEDARDGLTTSTDALDKLGVSVADLQGLSPEKAFEVLSAAIADVPDEITRAAVAQDVFGRAGTRLLPLLKEGAEGIEALRQEAHTLGIVFDQEAANKAAKMVDAMTRMKSSMTGVQLQIGSALAPVITKLADIIRDTAIRVREWAQEHPQLARVLTIVVAGLGAVMLVLGPMLIILPALAGGLGVLSGMLGLTTTTAAGATTAFGALNAMMLLNPFVLITASIVAAIAVGVLIWKNWDWITQKGAQLWNVLVPIFEKSINFLIDIFNKFTLGYRKGLVLLLEAAQKVAGIFSDDLASGIQTAIDAIDRGIPEVHLATIEIEAVGKAADETGKMVAGMARPLDDLKAGAEDVNAVLPATTTELEGVRDAAKETAKAVDEAKASWDNYRFQLSEAGKAAQIMKEDTAAALDAMAGAFQVTVPQFIAMLGDLGIAAEDTQKIMELWPDVAVEAVLGIQSLADKTREFDKALEGIKWNEAQQELSALFKQVSNSADIMEDWNATLITGAEASVLLQNRLNDQTAAFDEQARAVQDSQRQVESARASWDDYRFGISEVAKHLKEHRITTDQILQAIADAHGMNVDQVIAEFERLAIAAGDLEGIIESELGQKAVAEILKLKNATEETRDSAMELGDAYGRVFDKFGKIAGHFANVDDSNKKGNRADELGIRGEINSRISIARKAINQFGDQLNAARSDEFATLNSGKSVPLREFYAARIRALQAGIRAVNENRAGILSGELNLQKIFGDANQLKGLAHGVQSFKGGLAILGEHGPELADLPRGTRVFSNRESLQMVGRGGGNITVQILGDVYGMDDFNRKVAQAVIQGRSLGRDI